MAELISITLNYDDGSNVELTENAVVYTAIDNEDSTVTTEWDFVGIATDKIIHGAITVANSEESGEYEEGGIFGE
jgi:hypothetical protein